MIFFIAALTLLGAIGLVFYNYKTDHNKKRLAISVALIATTIFFTYISRVLLVHKLIFVFHIALLLICCYSLFLYLLKNRLNLLAILSPIFSIVLFVVIALFFRENG